MFLRGDRSKYASKVYLAGMLAEWLQISWHVFRPRAAEAAPTNENLDNEVKNRICELAFSQVVVIALA